MICTIYSHSIGFEKITDILKKVFPKGSLTSVHKDGSQIAELETKGGLFSSAKKLVITYRQRNQPSYLLPKVDDSPLTENLKGLYGYVSSLPANNEKIKDLFLQKILTVNSEFSILQEQGELKELKTLIQTLAQEFDAILFVQPNTIISKSSEQHFLDKNLNLILDREGNSEVDTIDVKINSAYFDKEQVELTEDQMERKAKSERLLEQRNIKLNRNLPYIESDKETNIRTPKEIAQRVCVLAITNLVAFNNLTSEEAIDYLQKYEIWTFVTATEKDFLAHPTEEKKNHETWKCEGIWTLLWALKKVNDLGFPDTLCSLDAIPPNDYPVGPHKDPNDFIHSVTETRSKSEILDANDLYYRLDWACVDARIHHQSITAVHPGVVYERHYALNWLINYLGQEWDDVSCDT